MEPIQYPETLPQTLQEFFNLAWQHAVVEKRPPAYDILRGKCLYRTEDGNCCLIGRAIPQKLWDEEINGKETGTETYSIMAQNAAARDTLRGFIPNDVRERLDALQACHDWTAPYPNSYFEQVRHNLTQYAENRGLTIPETEDA